MKFYSLVALLSVLVHCVFQVLASKCSTHLIIIIIGSNFFEECPSINVIQRVHTTNGSSSNRLGDDDYESYLEICTNTNPGTLWTPECGGELARVACNQLEYPNTTTLGNILRLQTQV